MKYKVGDKVRVRKDLEPGNFYGKDYYIISDNLTNEELLKVASSTSTVSLNK